MNPRDKDWVNYGARGITVCSDWEQSFEIFWEQMKDGYASHLTLERIDVNGNYEKSNCRWATRIEQGNNTRKNVLIQTPNGEMTVANAARFYGIKPITLYKRVEKGWTGDRLVSPVYTTS